MNQNIHTFRAATASEALNRIRKELGDDAEVVEIRQVAQRGLFAWLTARTQVEVTASVVARPGKPRRIQPTDGTIAAAHVARSAVLESRECGEPSYTISNSIPCEASGTAPFAATVQQAPAYGARPRTGSGPSSPSVMSPSSMAGLQQRLDALESMIHDLASPSIQHGLIEIPPELFPHYMALVESGVGEELARDLILRVKLHARENLSDSTSTMTLLTSLIEKRLNCGGMLDPRAGQQVVIVTGPKHAGKSSILFKLAAEFSSDSRPVGIITIESTPPERDTQVRTNAMPFAFPQRCVTDAISLQAALVELSHCGLVLIEAPALEPSDYESRQELAALIKAAHADHVYLVVNLDATEAVLKDTAECYSRVGATAVVFTKLDEASGSGGLLTAVQQIGIPLAYLSRNSDTSCRLEPANPCWVARLVLGADSAGSDSEPRIEILNSSTTQPAFSVDSVRLVERGGIK